MTAPVASGLKAAFQTRLGRSPSFYRPYSSQIPQIGRRLQAEDAPGADQAQDDRDGERQQGGAQSSARKHDEIELHDFRRDAPGRGNAGQDAKQSRHRPEEK